MLAQNENDENAQPRVLQLLGNECTLEICASMLASLATCGQSITACSIMLLESMWFVGGSFYSKGVLLVGVSTRYFIESS
jgi:hypothetical protein